MNGAEGIITTSKNDAITVTKPVPTSVNNQIKTVTSLFFDIVKTATPSVQQSLTELTKKINPFSSTQTATAAKAEEEVARSESGTSLPSYFDIIGRSKEKAAAPVIPLWKLKKRAATQESIDARTKHVVSAVTKAITKTSLLLRLEDLSNHLFQFPEAKSLAARVCQVYYYGFFFS